MNNSWVVTLWNEGALTDSSTDTDRYHYIIIEDSANMYKSPDADIQEEINKNISRLQLRRLRSKHKQQLLAKKNKAL